MEPEFVISTVVPLHVVEHDYALWILQLVRGNKAEAARLLQIDRSTLYRLLRSRSAEHRSALGERR